MQESFGDKIYNIRKKSGLSQEELAFQIGVSRQTISKWEAGSMQPNADNIRALAEVFNVRPDYFLAENYEELKPEVIKEFQPVVVEVEKVVEKPIEIEIEKYLEKPVIDKYTSLAIKILAVVLALNAVILIYLGVAMFSKKRNPPIVLSTIIDTTKPENKSYSDITLNDKFSDDRIIVTLSEEKSLELDENGKLRDFDVNDFGFVRCQSVFDDGLTLTARISTHKLNGYLEKMTDVTQENVKEKLLNELKTKDGIEIFNFERQVTLFLKYPGKANVLIGINNLEQYDWVVSAMPAGYKKAKVALNTEGIFYTVLIISIAVLFISVFVLFASLQGIDNKKKLLKILSTGTITENKQERVKKRGDI